MTNRLPNWETFFNELLPFHRQSNIIQRKCGTVFQILYNLVHDATKVSPASVWIAETVHDMQGRKSSLRYCIDSVFAFTTRKYLILIPLYLKTSSTRQAKIEYLFLIQLLQQILFKRQWTTLITTRILYQVRIHLVKVIKHFPQLAVKDLV